MKMRLVGLVVGLLMLGSGNAEMRMRVKRQEDNKQSQHEAHTIEQPINHFPDSDRYAPHTNATFKQRYFFDSSYYKPGGPVFVVLAGETDAEGLSWALLGSILRIWTEKFNGLGVILENRYYGKSYPFNTSTTDELRFLTTEQTIDDIVYFRQHATFPGVNATLSSSDTPWILYGGSMSGAHAAFTMKTYNDMFAGGIGSSATVQGLLEYPYWYDPIIKFGPSDCVSRIVSIVDKIDALIESGNEAGIQQLKDIFGLGSLSSLEDFAATIAFPIGGPFFYPLKTWQEVSWADRWDDRLKQPDFWTFCSNITDLSPPVNNTAVDTALAAYSSGEPWIGLGNYAAYIKRVLLPLCTTGRIDSTDQGCFGTQNQTYWADPTNSLIRSYLYSTCVELGGYQTAPKHGPSLISRVLQVNYTQQWCNWAFPPGKHHRIPPTSDPQSLNRYGGWNISARNLALIDGSTDPWLDITVHTNLVDRVVLNSDEHPRYLIAGVGHSLDFIVGDDVQQEPANIREAHLWEMRVVQGFLDRWRKR